MPHQCTDLARNALRSATKTGQTLIHEDGFSDCSIWLNSGHFDTLITAEQRPSLSDLYRQNPARIGLWRSRGIYGVRLAALAPYQGFLLRHALWGCGRGGSSSPNDKPEFFRARYDRQRSRRRNRSVHHRDKAQPLAQNLHIRMGRLAMNNEGVCS